MKVTGFSFVKNAVRYGYPIREAIRSILPICDEFVIAIGDSEDGTRALIEGMQEPKITIIDTVWDNTITTGGRVLAAETDKAFAAVSDDADWAFYIQGDEVVHEKDLDTIYAAMKKYKDDKRVDGLLFKYIHFWGSFSYVGSSSKWYRNEIRVVRNNKKIYSYRDAQGFRKNDNEKLWVKPIDAYIYHYGWVREPKAMQNKSLGVAQYWSEEGNVPKGEVIFDEKEYDYATVEVLKKFTGTHPVVMKDRIDNMNWVFHYDISKAIVKLKDKFKNLLEKFTGRRFFDYRNYKVLK